MNALVFALLWFGFCESLVIDFTGLVRSQAGDRDLVRRSSDEKDLRCGAVRAFLREKGLLEKSRSNVQQGESLGESNYSNHC